MKKLHPHVARNARKSDIYITIMRDLEVLGLVRNVEDIDLFNGPTEENTIKTKKEAVIEEVKKGKKGLFDVLKKEE